MAERGEEMSGEKGVVYVCVCVCVRISAKRERRATRCVASVC